MISKTGIAVSHGVAIGPAFILGAEEFRIPTRCVGETDGDACSSDVEQQIVEAELRRFHSAVEAVVQQINANEEMVLNRVGQQYSGIFGAHAQMARDPKFHSEVERLIRQRHYSPEYAVTTTLNRLADEFRSLPSPYLAERANDVVDLERRLLRELMGNRHEEMARLSEPVIVLAHNLTPSETASLPKELVLGFATEVGGRTSHTAILAGALELPAVVGTGSLLKHLSGGEIVIIDGNQGQVIIDPDPDTLESYRNSKQRLDTVARQLATLSDVEAATADGTRIQLLGNIEFPEEAVHCQELGADGIGLYRTEFLYLSRDVEPTEEDHFQAYRTVVEAMQGKPVTIRTCDLGADKIGGAAAHLTHVHANPDLGLRSIRLTLENVPLFKTQLRAILRVAALGDVRVMFPLISSLIELRQAKILLRDVAEELEDEGIEFYGDLPVGMMVEVPSVAICPEDFADEVDFFSIGTNDLIQYTLAVDRSDPTVSKFYNSADPAVLRLIRTVVEVSLERNVPVSLCGQMSSDLKFLPLLVGMGLRSFSVTPQVIPEIKELLRHLTIEKAEAVLKHARRLDLARDIEGYLRNQLFQVCPELIR